MFPPIKACHTSPGAANQKPHNAWSRGHPGGRLLQLQARLKNNYRLTLISHRGQPSFVGSVNGLAGGGIAIY